MKAIFRYGFCFRFLPSLAALSACGVGTDEPVERSGRGVTTEGPIATAFGPGLRIDKAVIDEMEARREPTFFELPPADERPPTDERPPADERPREPEVVCPENTSPREDEWGRIVACVDRCPAETTWVDEVAACVARALVDANGALIDSDGDGLTDYDEIQRGTNPNNRDSDADTIDDGTEVRQGTNPLLVDTDGDGIFDPNEAKYGTSPTVADTDGDGLSDGDEVFTYGTKPLEKDTDGDILSDCDEVRAGCPNARAGAWRESDPLKVDTDGDGLLDPFERDRGTDPKNPDTDGDGIDDAAEVRFNLNALSNSSYDTDGDGRIDNDADGDGLSDATEVLRLGTDPTKADTDGDGVSDFVEVYGLGSIYPFKTDPLKYDTDGDGVGDGDEAFGYSSFRWPTDPTKFDTDGDGLGDGEEVRKYGTDPTRIDTDGDGLGDGDEVRRTRSDPTKADTDGDGMNDKVDPFPLVNWSESDADWDGLSDAEEARRGTNPNDPDTDGDGLNDGDEVRIHRTNPKEKDSDGDGLWDGFEVKVSLTNPVEWDSDGDQDSDYNEYVRGGTTLATTRSVTIDSALPKASPPQGVSAVQYRRVVGALFPDGVKIEHVNQQRLGDCWFLASAAAVVAQDPSYIRDLFTDHGDGTYTVKLYKDVYPNRKPVFIRVDNRLPYEAKKDGIPVFAGLRKVKKRVNINWKLTDVDVPVLWPAILEKAAAVHYGNSYDHLAGDNLHGFFAKMLWGGFDRLTGFATGWHWGLQEWDNTISFFGVTLLTSKGRRTLFARQLMRLTDPAERRPMVVSTGFTKPDQNRCPGLAASHVYAVTGETRKVNGKTEYFIYNPWGYRHAWLTHAGITACFIGGGQSSLVFPKK